MFDRSRSGSALSAADVLVAVEQLAAAASGACDDDCIDQLDALERLKSACAAAQARITDDLAARAGTSDRGLANQVALARRESPHRGRGHLHLARALVHDLPRTLAALERGDISEEAAQVIATETAELVRADRLLADAELADSCDDTYDGLGTARLAQLVRGIVQRIDQEAVLRRRARAIAARRVTGRLLRDGTAQVTATVADWQYAAVMASLAEAADAARAAGDPRTRGQVQADTAVERLAGLSTATATPVALKLVMGAETLLGDDDSPAHVPGVGPIPAEVARRLAAGSSEVRSTIQRLYACPRTGTLLVMDSRAHRFPQGLRTFIELRDQTCRTPWCDAPIRHADHADPHRRGGSTTATNGQGLCESCNYAKESPGWRHRVVSSPYEPHTVEITTPTGHVHHSRAPALPRRTGAERVDDVRRHLTISWRDLTLSA